ISEISQKKYHKSGNRVMALKGRFNMNLLSDTTKWAVAFVNKTFMGFINGKLVDSAIIGLLCYMACSILDMPFTLLVSVIVGVTNIIPFFGPFIGAIPSSIIILMVSPVKCLIFIVFVLLLQQLDGNVIGPKILGSTTGISAFWVMFSIILGAGLFGFWGMLLGVPVFVVIYTAINVAVENSLKRKNLPSEQLDYFGLDHIDPISMEPIRKEGIQIEYKGRNRSPEVTVKTEE
ncbi:MAG: AI-2E family transporter, partial [Clostridia bacterium]|nr:AI-2E family transporter [Clostridia bacterium]